ncbi:MAG: threonylcarbamoyl-AMP synthase [Candidatus Portnoybacteria bacterium CG23_combo_of_CG06-09_8_20_14_all_37_13]|uniref:L-threonylcarbamoyladenylate synthase n=1 Tax=Candidatus Portnoybacteria bacterium CG23_combo_of_CG06-09_8_20_14_all_37_13 TaxID=1974819 RepID=A0A2G9YD97_9BACT|nr:MAG: threonylcarbamoyl-AMP synthase [Candidatus Portnoybacteria bacterium CG23_combo_of_CG06-09_8_20_14_all_37_13]
MRLSCNIQEAINVMTRGGAVIYPTDTVFGLGVNALNQDAIRRLYRIKNRPVDRPVPIIVADIKMAKKLAYISDKTEKVLEAVWPSAVTVILQKKSGGTIGLRIPNHPVPIQLAQKFPITGTSANLSGQETGKNIFQIQRQFQNHYPQPDLILDLNGEIKNQPSTVLDLTTQKPKIIRIGPVNKTQLLELLKT